MTKTNIESPVLSVTAENFNEIVQKIKTRELDLDVGQKLLTEFVKTPKLKNETKLEAYYHLSRIATELRSSQVIVGYLADVEKIPVSTPEEKLQLGHFYYGVGTVCSQDGCYLTSTEDSTDSAQNYFDRALKIAEELDNNDLAFKAVYGMAENLRSDGQYNEALELKPKLDALVLLTGNSMHKAWVSHLAGNICRKQGRYSEAISLFNDAIETFKANRNSYEYQYCLWALGTCYAAVEDEQKAKIFLGLAADSGAVAKGASRITLLSKMTLAELKTVVGKYERAGELYREILDLIGGQENSYFGRRMLRGKALLCIKRGDYDKANEIIDKLVVIAASENKEKELMRLRLLKAEVLLRTGESAQHEQASAMLQEALMYHQNISMNRHVAVCLELLGRLDSRMGYPAEAFRKAQEMSRVAKDASFERLYVRAKLIEFVLKRKLGESVPTAQLIELYPIINKLNAEAERSIVNRFQEESYDAWAQQLQQLSEHAQRFVNEFFEDFHFVPEQMLDMVIDPNSHYVREKHLGEIPFHNKFTLMRILLLLAEAPGTEFSKEDLAQKIWGQDYNPLRHDNNIYININRLRKLVEPNPRESRYIMNGSKGYYFNPLMKVDFSKKISDTSPRLTPRRGDVVETKF
ncbi:MAG: winged helix-turn-helix domain-containing protein [Bdellovibrionota bacterium]